MALPARRTPARALTASAQRLTKREDTYAKTLSLPWQYRALSYYDQIGELRYGSHFIARMMSRARIYPARMDDEGNLTEITSGQPLRLLDRLQDPGGGRTQLQYRYGLYQFLTGECSLFGYRLGQPDERWRCLWKDEIKILDGGFAVRLNLQKQETRDIGIAYRLWTPHPRHSDEPDSPVRAILDICDELLLLTMSVRSTAVTRLTNGVFVLPQEISPGAAEPVGDEDPMQNPLLADWVEHVSTAKEMIGTAEAALPFLMEIPYDYKDGVQWIKTHDPATDYMEKELRVEAIKRMALGMDMPPEALLGMTDANHWTAKQVMYDMWRSHGAPQMERFCDDISEAYLRPALEQEGEEWENVVVSYDDSKVVITPDRSEDADKALDRIAISYEGYRQLKGIDESMAPSEEEKEFMASLKLRQPIELEDGNLVIPQRGPVAEMNGNLDPSNGPPDPGSRLVSRQESRTASIGHGYVSAMVGAADLALHRCRELAGIRIRQKCRECGEDAPPHLVASTVAEEMKLDPMELVKDGASSFQALLLLYGYSPALAASLTQTLEVYAARTLPQTTHPELPAAFIAQLEKAKETSDALVGGKT